MELEKVGEVLNEYFALVFKKEKDMVDDADRHAEFLQQFLYLFVTKMTDEGHVVNFVCMDFSKAFDKIPHDRLIQKVMSQMVH
eukprot:g27724.t1